MKTEVLPKSLTSGMYKIDYLVWILAWGFPMREWIPGAKQNFNDISFLIEPLIHFDLSHRKANN